MENVKGKTRKDRKVQTDRSEKRPKLISQEDIRIRAFEIYQRNGNDTHNELADWLKAEAELRGFKR